MKKIITIIGIMAVCLMMFSCGNNATINEQEVEKMFNIEDSAKTSFTNICLKWAKCPEEFKLDNFETVFKTDSIIVMKFMARGRNGFGGWSVRENLGIYRIPFDTDSTHVDACYTIYDMRSKSSYICIVYSSFL